MITTRGACMERHGICESGILDLAVVIVIIMVGLLGICVVGGLVFSPW